MRRKFKASYDKEGDVLTIYRNNGDVKESIELSDEIVMDLDKDWKLVSLEVMDAYDFLHSLDKKFTRKMLSEINNAKVEVRNYRNYWYIILIFEEDNKVMLPVVSAAEYKSPLIASVSA
ncbi:DUF2283 domain-containing protein [Candidatus Woesearchaeota archaeon]|nr:DUF2283 domain-containing protein [Candidatus Woesearchaeota archaeon]